MPNLATRMRLLPLTIAAWLTAVTPSWANVPDWSQYPEAYEEYQRQQRRILWTVVGCVGVAVIAAVVLLVLLILWIVKRDQRRGAALRSAGQGVAGGGPGAGGAPGVGESGLGVVQTGPDIPPVDSPNRTQPPP